MRAKTKRDVGPLSVGRPPMARAPARAGARPGRKRVFFGGVVHGRFVSSGNNPDEIVLSEEQVFELFTEADLD